jgi:hypothetical protein
MEMSNLDIMSVRWRVRWIHLMGSETSGRIARMRIMGCRDAMEGRMRTGLHRCRMPGHVGLTGPLCKLLRSLVMQILMQIRRTMDLARLVHRTSRVITGVPRQR